MRNIGSFTNLERGERFSNYLDSLNIKHQIEFTIGTDWGSSDYGTPASEFWIINEDDLNRALEEIEAFKSNPEDPKYKVQPKPGPIKEELKAQTFFKQKKSGAVSQAKPPGSKGTVTLYLLILCVIIYIYSAFSGTSVDPTVREVPSPFIYYPNLYKSYLYDWPSKYALLDDFVEKFGVSAWSDQTKLSPEARDLQKAYYNLSVWQGYYPILVAIFQGKDFSEQISAPLFEKIRQGQLWRFFTPILLHGGIFHLFFNMLWLLGLGKQMEDRLGAFRYLFFILIVALVSNTFQYLMSGFSFVGFSGVLCGMLTFIWVRQNIAPWEGYPLQKATFMLLMVFIFAMFGIGLFSFFSETLFNRSFPVGIANTAHLTGAATGLLLGRLKYFNWRAK